MAVYNSSIGNHDDDSDITIINPSIIHEQNYEYVPIITRLKQANNSSENRQSPPIENITKTENSNVKNDFVVVYQDSKENAKQLEQLLKYYISDLKQESNTQIDCDKQLITRIMDLIRPAYTKDQQKMIELDHLTQEIADLHDKRHVEQKGKIEALRTEICQLKKMLMTTNSEGSLYNDNNRPSIFTISPQKRSINEYDQWTEIENDAKKLHEIVESQREQINEIVSLISQAAQEVPANVPAFPSVSDNIPPNDGAANTPKSNPSNIISSLLLRINNLTGHHTEQDPAPVVTPQNAVLENYSPGASPTQSMATLTLSSLQQATTNTTKDIEKPEDKPEENLVEIVEPERPSVNIPITPRHSTDHKKCPICNQEFPETITDEDMYDHIDKCLFASNMNAQPSDYECPSCSQKMPGIDEATYLQHLTDCYNRFI